MGEKYWARMGDEAGWEERRGEKGRVWQDSKEVSGSFSWVSHWPQKAAMCCDCICSIDFSELGSELEFRDA